VIPQATSISQEDFRRILAAQLELHIGTMNAITILMVAMRDHGILPAPLNIGPLERKVKTLQDALGKIGDPSISIEDILATFDGPLQ
jgi:hypothetical protein